MSEAVRAALNNPVTRDLPMEAYLRRRHARPPSLSPKSRPSPVPEPALMKALDRLRSVRPPAPPHASPPQEPPSVWTEAKVAAVLAAVRSTFANLANKHGVPIEEVVALVRDELNDPS
jgi:hypothetical protein